MSDIRSVELGTFVSSADAAARVRKAADQVQRKIDPREDQRRGRSHDDPGDQHEPADDDIATGAYDDHGRPRGHAADSKRPDDALPTGPKHLNIIV